MTDQPDRVNKADAAEALGVSERTVERLAARGDLTAYERPGFPTMYSVADVERLASTRVQAVRPAILPADGNGHGLVSTRPAETSPLEAVLVQVLQAALVALAHDPTGPTPHGPTGPTSDPWFITVREAAAFVGLGPKFLRRQIAEGKLASERGPGGGLLIDREDLDAWRKRRQLDREPA